MAYTQHTRMHMCRAEDFDRTAPTTFSAKPRCWAGTGAGHKERCPNGARQALADGSKWCATHSPTGVRRRAQRQADARAERESRTLPPRPRSALGLRVVMSQRDAIQWPDSASLGPVVVDMSHAYPDWAYRLEGDVLEAWSTTGMRRGWVG